MKRSKGDFTAWAVRIRSPRATHSPVRGARRRTTPRAWRREVHYQEREEVMQAQGMTRALATLALAALGAVSPASGQQNAPGHGVVFTTTNAAAGNELVMYHRRP